MLALQESVGVTLKAYCMHIAHSVHCPLYPLPVSYGTVLFRILVPATCQCGNVLLATLKSGPSIFRAVGIIWWRKIKTICQVWGSNPRILSNIRA